MDYSSPNPAFWLNASQVMLLRAALLDGKSAVQAWERWQADCDIDSVDSETFQLLPLVYLNLKRMEIAHPLMAKLRGIYKHTWFTNQVAIGHVFEVLKLLEPANVSALLLSALPLILLKHCDRGAFQIREVDLLVKIEEVDLVDALIQKAGWRTIKPLPPRNLRPLFHRTTYTHPDGTTLGLTWRPFTLDCPLDIDAQFCERGITCSSHGMTVLVPNANDWLLQTCVRGNECQLGLTPRSLAEAAMLIQAAESSIDWEVIAKLARQIDKLDSLRKCLGYLQGELNIGVPQEHMIPSQQYRRDDEDQIFPFPHSTAIVSMPSLLNSLNTMWNSFQILKRLDTQKQFSVAFARFMFSYYQHTWGVRRTGMVPVVAIVRLVHRLRRSLRRVGHSQMRMLKVLSTG